MTRRPDPPLPVVFSRGEALGRGMTGEQVQRRVGSGRWRRLRQGCYCLGATWEQADLARRHLLLVAAAVLATGPDHWSSHASAAAVHGLPLPRRPVPVHLTHPPGTATRYLTGLRVMAASLPEPHRTWSRGVPSTTKDRCVLDCLRHLETVDAVSVADAAVRAEPHLRRAVEALLAATSAWPRANRAAASWGLVDGRRESPAESWSFVAMARQGVPAPEPQVTIADAGGRFVGRVDVWWDDVAVVGEVDGLVKYGFGADSDPERARRALVREKEREDALRRLGAHVVRWGTKDLRNERRWAAWLRGELAHGDRSRFRGVAVRMTP